MTGEDEDLALIRRLAARVSELETWLGILVIQNGERNGDGFRFDMCSSCADGYRASLPTDRVHVAITYDVEEDSFVIDVI